MSYYATLYADLWFIILWNIAHVSGRQTRKLTSSCFGPKPTDLNPKL